jgi:hypothetical protein
MDQEFPGTNAVYRILEAWIGIDQTVMLNGVPEQPVENFTVGVQSFRADHHRAVIQVTVDQRWIDLFGIFGHPSAVAACANGCLARGCWKIQWAR